MSVEERSLRRWQGEDDRGAVFMPGPPKWPVLRLTRFTRLATRLPGDYLSSYHQRWLISLRHNAKYSCGQHSTKILPQQRFKRPSTCCDGGTDPTEPGHPYRPFALIPPWPRR